MAKLAEENQSGFWDVDLSEDEQLTELLEQRSRLQDEIGPQVRELNRIKKRLAERLEGYSAMLREERDDEGKVRVRAGHFIQVVGRREGAERQLDAWVNETAIFGQPRLLPDTVS